MKQVTAFAIAVFLLAGVIGCEPEEQYHARILGGQLKILDQHWREQGRPAVFVVTNYVYIVGSTNQYYMFTNKVDVKGVSYHCRFGVRDPDRFQKPGVLAISDEGVLLWIGDDGKIDVAPDTKGWSSK